MPPESGVCLTRPSHHTHVVTSQTHPPRPKLWYLSVTLEERFQVQHTDVKYNLVRTL